MFGHPRPEGLELLAHGEDSFSVPVPYNGPAGGRDRISIQYFRPVSRKISLKNHEENGKKAGSLAIGFSIARRDAFEKGRSAGAGDIFIQCWKEA